MHNTQVYSLTFYAYHFSANHQLAAFKDRSDDWRWVDVEARAPVNATHDQIRLMFQSLLEDRFKLKVHRETRTIAEYELAVEKGKPRPPQAREGDIPVAVEGRTFSARAGAARCCGTKGTTSSAMRPVWMRSPSSSAVFCSRRRQTTPV